MNAAPNASRPTRQGGETPASAPGATGEVLPPRSLVEDRHDLVVTVSPAGALVSANAAWCERLGIPPAEVPGLSLFEVVPWQYHATCQSWLQSATGSRNGVWLQFSFQSRSGAEVPVEGFGSVGTEGGQPVLQGNFRDITEQRRVEVAHRESEERFRLLSHHAPVGVFQTDAGGRLTHTNARWRQMVGLLDVAEPRGVWWQAVHPEDREQVLRDWESTVRHGHEFAAEFRLRPTTGPARWARTRVAQVHGPAGEIRFCVGITEDITEHKQIEEELAKARDAALEAGRVKSQFLANMSHEVRTPMNGVIGLLDLMLDSPLEAQQRKFAETARDSACQLLAILNDILDLSRIEAGRLTLHQSVFSLRGLVEACINFLAPKARGKGLTLTASIDPRLPDTVRGDAGRLRQVLANLIGNAVKFTEHGRIEVTMARTGGTEAIPRCRCTVRDTGIGIAAEAQEQLFQPFVQVDGSATRRFGGTGLGLAICRQLVEMMGGQIGVESQPGVGSTFWFTLDLQVLHHAPLNPPPPPTPGAGSTGVATPLDPAEVSRLKVLLAEDNAVNLKVALWQLDRLGCAARTVTDGQEVLRALREEWYDLILIDCQMPGMDGFEATRLVRALEADRRLANPQLPPIYIAALTAHAMAGDRERCLAAGMDDYVSKPARSSDFEGLFRRCLERQRTVRPAAVGGAS